MLLKEVQITINLSEYFKDAAGKCEIVKLFLNLNIFHLHCPTFNNVHFLSKWIVLLTKQYSCFCVCGK